MPRPSKARRSTRRQPRWRGRKPHLSVAALREGQHVITLRADDGDGGVTEASVRVNVVSEEARLPDALMVGPTTILFDASAEETSAPLSIANATAARSIRWSANSSASWARLDASAGTTPGDASVSLHAAGLAVGTHEATLTFTSADLPGVSVDVRISVTVATSGALYLPVLWR